MNKVVIHKRKKSVGKKFDGETARAQISQNRRNGPENQDARQKAGQ